MKQMFEHEGGVFRKLKTLLLTDVKIINKYFLIIFVMFLLTIVGTSSYAMFTYEDYSPSSIHIVYNPLLPECTITASPSGEATSKTLTIDGNSVVLLDGYSWNGLTYSSTKTKTITENGTYTAYVKDSSNNISTCSVTVSDILSCSIIESAGSSDDSRTLTITGNDKVTSNGYSWNGSTYSSIKTKTITENGIYTAYVKDSNNNVSTCSIRVKDIPGQETIFSLYEMGDFSIGDFVTYDAGTWTQAEINSIKVGANSSLVSANNSTSLPTNDYQFGGFVAGQSRNVGAIENEYMYAKMYDGNDSSNKVALSGWRIFDIDNNYVTLISAANPEDYHQAGSWTQPVANVAYISQYILTGIKDSDWSGNTSSYTKRNWSMYNNNEYGGTNARLLTLVDLTNWFNKYLNSNVTTLYRDDGIFRQIYSSPYLKYQNLIDNHSLYWLADAASHMYLSYVAPQWKWVDTGMAMCAGVRVLVFLPLSSKVQVIPINLRTVTLEGMGGYGPETTQTYNVWELVPVS